MTICDPACGTGRLPARRARLHRRQALQLDRDQKKTSSGTLLRHRAGRQRGPALRDEPAAARHRPDDGAREVPDQGGRRAGRRSGDRYDMVLTNPPFGKKSASRSSTRKARRRRRALTVIRDDFWATTSNKQLNFLQHVKTLLKITAGRRSSCRTTCCSRAARARRSARAAQECDVHTLLRLPTGIFYAQGVKANVLFFDRKPAQEEAVDEKLWIYDLRTNKHFTLKENPLKRSTWTTSSPATTPRTAMTPGRSSERWRASPTTS